METIRKKVKEIYDLSHGIFYDKLVFEIDAEFYNLYVTLNKYYERLTIGIGMNADWQWDNIIYISFDTKEKIISEISLKKKFLEDKNFSDLEKKVCILLDRIIEKTKKLQKEKKRIKEEEKQKKLEELKKEIQKIENS